MQQLCRHAHVEPAQRRIELGVLPGHDLSARRRHVPHHAAPARAEDLSGLPPAYISTMEFDPLRDEGVLYALQLMQAGVPTELHSFPGTFHGSSLFARAQVSQRESARNDVVLRRGLRTAKYV